MRRFCMMALCGLGLMVSGAAESQAGCCLFGCLFPCYQPQTCCYAPPPCCPTSCCPTTCGYAPQACCPTCPTSGAAYAPAGCPTCAPCGSSCPSGDCGVTYQAAPSSAAYTPAPGFFAPLAKGFFQPVIVTSPRYTVQTTSRVIEPVGMSEAQTPSTKQERRHVTSGGEWEPVGVVR